jgi:hypothetical protein
MLKIKDVSFQPQLLPTSKRAGAGGASRRKRSRANPGELVLRLKPEAPGYAAYAEEPLPGFAPPGFALHGYAQPLLFDPTRLPLPPMMLPQQALQAQARPSAQARRRPGGAERERARSSAAAGAAPHERDAGAAAEQQGKQKERPPVWDARMQAGLSALLGRLLCSRRALEAAWNLAPGITAATAKRAMGVIPELRPRVHGICAALDTCTCPSMTVLLDQVRDACNAACTRAITAAEAAAVDAAAAEAAARAAEPACGAAPAAAAAAAAAAPEAAAENGALPSCADESFGVLSAAEAAFLAAAAAAGYPAAPYLAFAAPMAAPAAPMAPAAPPMCAAERITRDAAWLVDTLRVVLRSAESSIAQGKATFPESITRNREPYMQADWQTTPFPRRPYVRLNDYQIMTDGLGEEVSEIAAKLRAGERASGCSGDCCRKRAQLGTFSLVAGRFVGDCACLNGSQECGPTCGCGGTCVNTNVATRKTLQLGVHVAEVDVWGLDCYARRNVHDAVRDAHLLDGAPEALMATWTERALLPAINAAGRRGWDLKTALRDLHARAKAVGDRWSASAAAAVAARVSRVGRVYFRTHPKGCGIICIAPGGLPAQTFVEEYFGEVHPPWRWFEKQDALKRRRRAGDLPDFYNISLERPKDDPGGFDVLFVDAAPAGSFASRLSHSCQPNCQAVVMSAGGRLTIAVYTLRWIAPGEELTFDYSSVTESDAEYRAAICLCGTSRCRGSFLYWAGSSSFQQVMALRHTFVDRNALLVRAGMEPLTAGDRELLERSGVRFCALGGDDGAYAAPEWLAKWAALTLLYIEEEKAALPSALYAARELGYTPEGAAEQARGVAENRLQNLIITLDKVKHVLRQPGQPQGPPLRLLSEAETAAALWSASDSMAQRLVDTSASYLCSACRAAATSGVHDTPGCAALHQLRNLCTVPDGREGDRALAVQRLFEMEVVLRGVDTSKPAGGRHAAAADLAHFYATTQRFFTSERYNTVVSPPVTLREEEVGWTSQEPPCGFLPGVDPLGPYVGTGARSANAAAAAAAAAAETAARAPVDVEGGGEFDAPENDDDWWVTDARTAVRWTVQGSGAVLPREVGDASEALHALAEPGSPMPAAAQAAQTAATAALSPLGGVPARSLLNAPRAPKPAPKPAEAPPPLPPPSSDGAAADGSGDDGGGDGDDEAPAANANGRAAGDPSAPRPQALSALQEAKKYRPAFVWGQLTGWFKQTVLDPTASLSADRRGTVSLPDVDSCYGKYSLKDRTAQLSLVAESPGAMWPVGTLWSFKNTARVYGSPMLDAAIARSRGEEPVLPRIIQDLMVHGMAAPAPAPRSAFGGAAAAAAAVAEPEAEQAPAAMEEEEEAPVAVAAPEGAALPLDTFAAAHARE